MNAERDRMVELFHLYAADGVRMVEENPAISLRRVVHLCESAPDDEHLGALAVVVLDALLDTWWDVIERDFIVAMQSSRPLRRCFSASMPGIPQEAVDLLDSLVSPDERLD